VAKETLSIELEPGLAARVRRYSEEHGTNVSQTISALIASLPSGEVGDTLDPTRPNAGGADDWENDLPPITRSLYGIASGHGDVEDYREHLWQKHMR
jgi:hypothetical protein